MEQEAGDQAELARLEEEKAQQETLAAEEPEKVESDEGFDEELYDDDAMPELSQSQIEELTVVVEERTALPEAESGMLKRKSKIHKSNDGFFIPNDCRDQFYYLVRRK